MARRDGATRRMLVSSIDGYNHRFGELVAGRPFDTDVEGRSLTVTEMRELAEKSEFLELTQVPEAEAEAAREAEEAPA